MMALATYCILPFPSNFPTILQKSVAFLRFTVIHCSLIIHSAHFHSQFEFCKMQAKRAKLNFNLTVHIFNYCYSRNAGVAQMPLHLYT